MTCWRLGRRFRLAGGRGLAVALELARGRRLAVALELAGGRRLAVALAPARSTHALALKLAKVTLAPGRAGAGVLASRRTG